VLLGLWVLFFLDFLGLVGLVGLGLGLGRDLNHGLSLREGNSLCDELGAGFLGSGFEMVWRKPGAWGVKVWCFGWTWRC
jgi:hypothetical protein